MAKLSVLGRWAPLLTLSFTALLPACGGEVEDAGARAQEGSAAAGGDGEPSGAAGLADGAGNGAGSAAAGAMADDGMRCPDAPGPRMVRAGSYCIDGTEVTNEQYGRFITADVPPQSEAGAPAVCAWNTTYVPRTTYWPLPESRALLPVTYVDWCDAYAYCRWAGKHLCGRMGGGGNDLEDRNDESRSEWYNACSKGGTRTYPYGDRYVPALCVDRHHPSPGRNKAPVGTAPDCEGGLPGLLDMSGNAAEWENSCEASEGEDDLCLVRGGSKQDADDRPDRGDATDFFPWHGPFLQCATPGHGRERSHTSASLGFRCCADLVETGE